MNESCVTNDTSCSPCCVNQVCSIGPYFPNECTFGCIDGHRGAKCYELCTNSCKKCSYDNDECEICSDGFYPGVNKDCTSKCPSTCKTCTSYYRCDTCKEGFFNKGGFYDCRYRVCPENCQCINGECVACKEGFYDTNTNCTSECPNDDCSQCRPGMFGKQCEHLCSTGCRDNACEIKTGKCDCSDYFSGDMCTECVRGKHGVSCDKTCPDDCNNTVCGKTLGDCTEGCNDWYVLPGLY